MEKIKITSKCQFEKLVEALEKNPSLARGFRRGTVPSNFKEQWETIATVINSLGPPIRTGDGWQKIWRDLKFKVKKKMATNKAESKATGGGVYKQVMLSPLEEAVANLLQFQKQINPEGMVQGVPNTEDSVDVYFLESLELERERTISSKAATPSTSAPTATLASSTSSAPTALFTASVTSTAPSTSTASKPSTAALPSTASTTTTTSFPNPLKRNTSSAFKKNEKPAERNEMLEMHSTNQARILTEVSNSITSLKRSLREIKDIETKKFKLEVERSKREVDRSKREEERHLTDMKIKRIELIIKEKELQLLSDH